jgi:eukaryotic-like serine/threonine-protein kinase
MLWHNLRLETRRLEYEPRAEQDADPALLLRADTLWSLGHGMTGVSPVHGAALIARAARVGLEAGESRRIATTLAMHGALLASVTQTRFRRSLEAAGHAAARAGDPYSLGFVEIAWGMAHYFRGELGASLEAADRGVARLRAECRGVAFELLMGETFSTFVLAWRGDLPELARRIPVLVRDAEQRGDYYGAATLSLGTGWLLHLSADDPDGLEQAIDAFGGRWSGSDQTFQYFFETFSRAQAILYRGDGEAALRYLDERRPQLRRDGHFHMHVTRLLWLGLYSRALIGAAQGAEPARRRRLLGRARRGVRRVARVPYALARLTALQIEGCLAAALGRDEEALAMLAAAEEEGTSLGLDLSLASVRRLRGVILGGDEGAALRAEADAEMVARGVRDPARMTALWSPGRS